MSNALRVLMLLSDGFGGIGGIAKFNRDFLRALDSCTLIERVYAQPRVIHVPIDESLPEAVIYDRKAAAGKAAFMRRLAAHVWRGAEVDLVICGHVNLLPAAWLLALIHRTRLALIIHGLEAWEPSDKPLVNRLARTVDSLISVSNFSADRFASWAKVPRDRAFILPNCVDLQAYQPQGRDSRLVKRYGLESSKIILTVGRLAPDERYKGFDEVIDIMPVLVKQFPSVKYLIVGDGPDRSRLEAKAETLGVSDNVIFAGYVREDEKAAHYNLADVYLMPSLGEGFGIVLIEAAACGVPVIGSIADGSREALLGGRLGHLVDPRKPQEVLAAVSAVLESGSSHKRCEAIETFGVQNFRARVAEWCRSQVVGRAA